MLVKSIVVNLCNHDAHISYITNLIMQFDWSTW